MKRDSFLIYTEYNNQIQILDIQQRGVLFTNIMNYQSDVELIEMDPVTAMAFSFIKTKLDKDNTKYKNTCEKNKQNIGKRWNKENTKNTTRINGINENTKNTDNEYDNESDNDNDLKEEENNGEEEKSSSLKDIDIALKNFLYDYNISLDSYSSDVYEIDFEKLHNAFGKSEWLKKNITSFSKVCKLYPKIISGYYNDYLDVEEVIIPQERWGVIERIIGEMKYNSQNFNSQYDDYDIHKAKQLSLYDRLTVEEKAYFGDYYSFYSLLEYKSLENEKARFMRDFEKFVKKWRKKEVAS